MQRKRN